MGSQLELPTTGGGSSSDGERRTCGISYQLCGVDGGEFVLLAGVVRQFRDVRCMTDKWITFTVQTTSIWKGGMETSGKGIWRRHNDDGESHVLVDLGQGLRDASITILPTG